MNERLDNLRGDQPAHFQSRFSGWIRAVSLVIILVFVPEQASWAFNYNPLVLWGNKTGDRVQGSGFSLDNQPLTNDDGRRTPSDDEIVSARIAASVQHLLDKVAYKEKTRVQLQLTDPQDKLTPQRSLLIDSDTMFTSDRIRRISDWLKDPNIHPLNCGVYAMKDLLAGRDIEVPLEELSVASLTVDLMSDIVRPGEPKLKTSLYAINKVVSAYGLDFKPAKLAPDDILKLKTPFIASFGSEHFVTVTGVDAQNVYYTDIGRAESMPREDFVAQLSGFVFADSSSLVSHPSSFVNYELVPDSMQAFIWGNTWVDNSKNLPGLVSQNSVIISIIIAVISIILCVGGATSWFGLVGNTTGSAGTATGLAGGAANTVGNVTPAMSSVYGTSLSVASTSTSLITTSAQTISTFSAVAHALAMYSFSNSLGQFTGTLNQVGVMKGWWDEETGFILATAITVALSVGVGYVGSSLSTASTTTTTGTTITDASTGTSTQLPVQTSTGPATGPVGTQASANSFTSGDITASWTTVTTTTGPTLGGAIFCSCQGRRPRRGAGICQIRSHQSPERLIKR